MLKKLFIVRRHVWSMLVLGGLLWSACRQSHSEKRVAERHMAEMEVAGLGRLYADTVPARILLSRETGQDADEAYTCIKVGIAGDLTAMSKADRQRYEEYWQFRCYRDWQMVNQSDSIPVVFSQALFKGRADRSEMILVFDKPRAGTMDTLVYRDSYGTWGTRVLVLQ